MRKILPSLVTLSILSPLLVSAMSIADYNACVQEAVEAGEYDTTHCTHYLTGSDDGSDNTTQQSSSAQTSEQTFSTQEESSSASAVSSDVSQTTISSEESISSSNSTSSVASTDNSNDTNDDEDDDEDQQANTAIDTGVQTTGGTHNSPCPDRSRGTTAEEKNGNPNFMCKCLEGYIPDPSKRTCIQDFYGVTSKKSSSSTSYVVARNLDYVTLPADVPAHSWYARALKILIYEGYIDEEVDFRPAAEATRGEFIMLLVRSMVDEHSASSSSVPTFDDLPSEFIPHFELAASKGWIQGEGNCIGTHPCYIKPDAPLNRAAAAVLMNRAFSLTPAQNAPLFMDVNDEDWFAEGVRTTASRCILRGDEGTGYVRPSASLNRAEMAVMLERIEEGKAYPYCN